MRVACVVMCPLLLSAYFRPAGRLGVLVQEPQQLGLEPQLQQVVLALQPFRGLRPCERDRAGLVVLAQLPEQLVASKKAGHPVSQVGELLADEL